MTDVSKRPDPFELDDTLDRIGPAPADVDQCTDTLRRAILRGKMVPGQALPAEPDLAQSLAVSPATVRSALEQLVNAKLLSVRQSGTHYVRDFRDDGSPDLVPGLGELVKSDQPRIAMARDLLLVRRQMARAVLVRLSESPTPGAAERVAKAVDAMRTVVEAGGGPASVARADLEVLFHVVDATGSPVLRLCFNPVVQALAGFPALRDAIYAEPVVNLRAWEAMTAWLAAPQRALIGTILESMARRDALTLRLLRDGQAARRS